MPSSNEISEPARFPSAPVVSIAMLAYMHEAFLAQAIEGVLMQETDFPFELVIGEDCSSDRTREIALEYQRRYPERVRVIVSESNVGMHENVRRVYAACRAPFIACCEGDDFWTDPRKLAKQVSYLRSHPECVLVFHTVKRISFKTGAELAPGQPDQLKTAWTIADILKANFIIPVSVLFRNLNSGHFPEWIYNPQLPMLDWPTFVYLLMHGEAHWMAEPMATYRVHEQGAWSGMTEKKKILGFIAFHQTMVEVVPKPLRRISRRSLSQFYLALSKASHDNRANEWMNFWRSFRVLDPRDISFEFRARVDRLSRMSISLLSKDTS
jgi:glycosyltransferase involved in cell wall biosynthesis